MKRAMLLLLLAGLFLSINLWPALGSSSAWAFAASRYQLAEGSNYQEGCFDPCMCPILLNETLQGSFILNLISQDEGMDIYEVLEIDWQFVQGDETVQVSGSGLYLIGRDTQSISLDLKVGEGPIQHFESGIVPLQAEFPEISIAAAVNGFFCYDYVFCIAAIPASVNLEHDTWGCLKSTYR
jgi:hypothetical protein